MKLVAGLVLIILAMASEAVAGDLVWTTNGPPGGPFGVATDPAIPGLVYTGAFRSLDGGMTWQSYGLNPSYELGPVTSGTTSTVYVGGGSGDSGVVLSSVDAGANWTLAATIPNPNAPFSGLSYVTVESLYGDPVNSAVVYAVFRYVLGPGLFNEDPHFERSSDGGQTWNATTLPVRVYQGVDLAISRANPSLLLAAVAGAGGVPEPQAVYRSLDSGATWTTVNSLPSPTYSVRFDPRASNVAYALGAGGFSKSTDGGATFAVVSSGLTDGAALVVSPTQPGRFFAVSGYSVVVASSDGGVTWSPLGEGLPPQTVYGLTIDATGRHLYAASTSGVFVLDLTPGTLTLNTTHPFDVTLSAVDPHTGQAAPGVATQVNDLWGYFSLPAITNNPKNPEVFVKLLDGTAINGEYWFFYGGLTSLEYTLTVTDSATGAQKTYTKHAGSECGGSDTAAFSP
jgi:photosystem II stability/assembly factor-like uncharacterized protein